MSDAINRPLLDVDLTLGDRGNGHGLPSAFAELLSQVRRHLHRNPEVGFEEHRTYAYIRAVLESHGLEVRGPLAGTGLSVDVEGASPGPTIAYRADIDALPIQDAKNAPYASQVPGVAHLCGHDAHTALAVGVALLLHHNRERLNGRVRVFFQPNEEGMPSGAGLMIDEGVLEDVEAIYAVHVDPTLEVGQYGLLAGPITASTDQFTVRIDGGSTGHSARPQEATDTIWVASLVMNALYQLIGRMTDVRNPSVLTICRIRGGDAYNVIPRDVEFGGTMRSTSPEERGRLIELVQHVADDTARTYGAKALVEIQRGSPPVINDARLVADAEEVIREVFGDGAIYHVPRPSMGAEDFAHYVERVPGMLLRVGTYSDERTAHPLHDAHFDIDERSLAPTAFLMAKLLLHYARRRSLSQ